MAIHSGSSFGPDAPYEIVGSADLEPAVGAENAWYSASRKVLVVELGVRRYETIANVEPDEVPRLTRASREADARYPVWLMPPQRGRRRRRPG